MSTDDVTITYERRPHRPQLGLHESHALERKRIAGEWSVTFRSELSYCHPRSREECKESFSYALDAEYFQGLVDALDECPMFVTPTDAFALGVGGRSLKIISAGSTIEFHWLTLPESWTAVRYLCEAFDQLIRQFGPLAQYERLHTEGLLEALDQAAEAP